TDRDQLTNLSTNSKRKGKNTDCGLTAPADARDASLRDYADDLDYDRYGGNDDWT
ncbi:unnamed protein product, partial [Rotaria sp. Silwood1]